MPSRAWTKVHMYAFRMKNVAAIVYRVRESNDIVAEPARLLAMVFVKATKRVYRGTLRSSVSLKVWATLTFLATTRRYSSVYHIFERYATIVAFVCIVVSKGTPL